MGTLFLMASDRLIFVFLYSYLRFTLIDHKSYNLIKINFMLSIFYEQFFLCFLDCGLWNVPNDNQSNSNQIKFGLSRYSKKLNTKWKRFDGFIAQQ